MDEVVIIYDQFELMFSVYCNKGECSDKLILYCGELTLEDIIIATSGHFVKEH